MLAQCLGEVGPLAHGFQATSSSQQCSLPKCYDICLS